MTTRELATDITTFLDWFAFCPGWEHFADSEGEAITAIASTLEDKATRDTYRDEIADALSDPPEVPEYIALGERILEALDGFEEAREVELLILKGTLLYIKFYPGLPKEEEREYTRSLVREGFLSKSDLVEWIDRLRDDLHVFEEPSGEYEDYSEGMEAYYECASLRRERDEWDDLWDDRARSVGAVM